MALQHSPGHITDAAGNTQPLKRAFKDATAATADQVLVAAVAGKKIRVHRIILSFVGAGTIVFKTKPAGASTAISITYNGSAAQYVQIPAHGDVDKHGLFETAAGDGLVVTTGGAGVVGVQIKYSEQ